MVVEPLRDEVGQRNARDGVLKVFDRSEGSGTDENMRVLHLNVVDCNFIRAERVSDAAIALIGGPSCHYLVLVAFLERIGWKPPETIAGHFDSTSLRMYSLSNK